MKTCSLKRHCGPTGTLLVGQLSCVHQRSCKTIPVWTESVDLQCHKTSHSSSIKKPWGEDCIRYPDFFRTQINNEKNAGLFIRNTLTLWDVWPERGRYLKFCQTSQCFSDFLLPFSVALESKIEKTGSWWQYWYQAGGGLQHNTKWSTITTLCM